MFGNFQRAAKEDISFAEIITSHSRTKQLFPCYLSMNNLHMTTSADRARLLIKKIGPKKASEAGGVSHDRWLSVSKGAVRVSTEEIDVLIKLFPQYALWLANGQVAPEIGQTSPDYDEANRNLNQPNAG